jgi:rhodanese-related sulfurtransferase
MCPRIAVFAWILLTIAVVQGKDPIPPAPAKFPAGVREISIADTEKLLLEHPDLPVIDVRTAGEYAEQGHLPRAQLVDFFREDFSNALGSLNLDPAKPCVVYCAIGGRARRAAEKMAKLGYKEILLPQGSFKAWKEAGKTIEGGKK